MAQPATGNGLVWLTEREIEWRLTLERQLVLDVREALASINQAIQVRRVETPCLVPASWLPTHLKAYRIEGGKYALRAESTAGTYMAMDALQLKLPTCLYQVNKSFRDEDSEAMRFSAFRFREFYQVEFQLFYAEGSKADYHQLFVDRFPREWGEPWETPVGELPPYSTRTTDLELPGTNPGAMKVEVASLSSRKDFRVPVFEMSFGLDRLAMLK